MSSPTYQIAKFEAALMANAPDYDIDLSTESVRQLGVFYQLINTWNPRLHLVAPCSEEEFAQRHILESLLLLRHLPAAAKVVDVGSGAGLPMIPCLIARPNLSAVLIESTKRKAIFLREALKVCERIDAAVVIAERFEALETPQARFITSRALNRFAEMLPRLLEWAPRESTLMLFGGYELERTLKSLNLDYRPILVPKSEQRFLFLVEPRSAG
jgi:16S rRNA (guanine527-N7)-methyltransferase